LMGVRGENAYLRHLTLRVLKALSSNYWRNSGTIGFWIIDHF
jgi:hypothetical protein